MRYSKGLLVFVAVLMVIALGVLIQTDRQRIIAQTKDTKSLIQSLIDSKQPFVIASITTGGQTLLVDGVAGTVADLGDQYICVTSSEYFKSGSGSYVKNQLPNASTICMDFAALIVIH